MEGQEPGADLEALIRRLRLHQPPPSPYAGRGHPPTAATPTADQLFQPRRAAVLVCLFRGTAGELRVILTRRSSSLSTHSGEVALPGGKADKGDPDDAATALREAKEEIGLDPSLVTVVASLGNFLSKDFDLFNAKIYNPTPEQILKIDKGKHSQYLWQHRLVVVPIVGVLSDIEAFKPVLNIHEVNEMFDVPLEMFLKDENRRSEELEQMGITLQYFDYEKGNKKYVIWGLTARILIHAASIVYQRPPDFVERRLQFNMSKY